MKAVTKLTCLTLKRDTFVEILGPLERIMAREKSPQVQLLPTSLNEETWRETFGSNSITVSEQFIGGLRSVSECWHIQS